MNLASAPPQQLEPERGTLASALYPPAVAVAPLRVGLLVDGDTVPAWVARIVAQIRESGFAQVVIVVRNGEQPRRLSLRARIRARLRHLLYQRYTQRDSARRRGPDSAFAYRDLQPLVGDASWLTVEPKRRGHVHRFSTADLARIRAAQPDLLLRFGFNILRGEILGVARHGVWSYHHDDSAQYRGGPAMFWEIFEGNPLTGTVLQRLSEELDAGHVLYRSHAATHPHSLELNRNAAYWKASSFVLRCLRTLAAGDALPETVSGRCDKPLYRTPGNLRMAQFLGTIAARKSHILVEDRLRVPHWFVAWRRGNPLLDPHAPRLSGLRELPCPRGHFYADPLLHLHHGEPWLFVEDYDYRRGKGTLAVLPWSDDGPAGTARTVLDLDVHLSYPFVFEWRGETYLVPESAAAHRISLFRARAFPDRWEFVCDLLQGHRAVDATLHEHDGRWYLFANVCEAGGGTYDELFLFHADTPLGPFRPHPGNPIVSDVRRARPAGRLFTRNGQLIRPAQDCARGYGNAVVFNHVQELSPSRYREQPLGRLAPDWAPGLSGCHTYSALAGFEIVDGKRPTWRRSVGAPR
ncbi:hypothetical protein ACFOLC_02170 [Lysobacter cavernae]|uniref:Glucosamine inositolphosphorylceramide transferase 1 N-terminal domain-containing protein n=1 Tax=Lysobacter cavernae TaxID=1685901 RepID=A0ABV7RJK3_9GAMM